jgi:transposase-like protein
LKRSSSTTQAAVKLSKETRDTLSQLLAGDLDQIAEMGVTAWLGQHLIFLAELLLNAEVLDLVGRRYERNTNRECGRHGTQPGSVLLLEQRVPINKPRVRTKRTGGTEVPLQMYELLNDQTFLNKQAAAKLLGGLSTRRLGQTLDDMLRGRGVSRQTISARAVSEMSAKLEEFHTRPLKNVQIAAVFIDGIHIGDNVYIAAVGIDKDGKRHILDFEPGSTESASVCRTLFRNLLEREILREDATYLFVIDGGRGVKKAINEVFGKRAYIQRCIVHKKRNVLEKLPKKEQAEFGHKFNAAYNQRTEKGAETALLALQKELILNRRTAAANSLTEGLIDLLTLHRLKIDGPLRKSLYSTNCIESVFSAARYYARNVKRWRKEEQIERWLAAGLLEAEKNLKRVPGYTNMKRLMQALQK